jgi:hypothetical protein
MKNIKRTLESAMREGLTLDEVYRIAEIISENIVKEREKENAVGTARVKLTEALVEYVNIIAEEEVAHFQVAYDLIDANDDFLLELFESPEEHTIKIHTPEAIVTTTAALTEEEMEALKSDFAEFAKRLGF